MINYILFCRKIIPIIFRNFALADLHFEKWRPERMGKLETTWRWLGKRKCFIVCVLFFTNLIFLDHNSLLRRYEQRNEIATLRAEKERYFRIYERDKKQIHALETDPRAIEKIARERYFMKKADEDVFVFEYEGNDYSRNETAK